MRIGIDLDGVVVDFHGYLYDELKKAGVKTLPPKNYLKTNLYWEHLVNEKEETKLLLEDIFKGDGHHWENMPPYNEAELPELSKLISNKDIEVFFITARPPRSENPTRKWLEKHLKTNDFHLVAGCCSKAEVCSGLYLSHYIDDRYLYAYEVAKYGVTKTYLLSNPDNDQYFDVEKDNITRVESLSEFLKKVTKWTRHS